jgi:hypothetical protein
MYFDTSLRIPGIGRIKSYNPRAAEPKYQTTLMPKPAVGDGPDILIS